MRVFKVVREPFADRFWRKVAVAEPTVCWLWRGSVTKKGYGKFGLNRFKWELAHRVAYMLTRGDPSGLLVCHRCDVPGCVNPSHLFLGTVRDNAVDMVAKGRAGSTPRPGESNPAAILTATQVVEVLRRSRAGEVRTALAESYGVNKNTISLIVQGKTWRGVPEVDRERNAHVS